MLSSYIFLVKRGKYLKNGKQNINIYNIFGIGINRVTCQNFLQFPHLNLIMLDLWDVNHRHMLKQKVCSCTLIVGFLILISG